MYESLPAIGIFIGIPVMVILYKIFSKPKGEDYEDYEAVPFAKYVKEKFKEKLDMQGTNVTNGSLMLGFNRIANVDKYIKTKGEFDVLKFDAKMKELVPDVNEKGVPKKYKYDVLIFRTVQAGLFSRLLKTGMQYFIISSKSKDKITYYPDTNTWRLPEGLDFNLYGDIWYDDRDCAEYINQLGILYMNQELMTQMMSSIKKVVVMELNQAKKERTSTVLYDLEKGKYDAMKEAGNTVVT